MAVHSLVIVLLLSISMRANESEEKNPGLNTIHQMKAIRLLKM
jgi:hypothetical protein